MFASVEGIVELYHVRPEMLRPVILNRAAANSYNSLILILFFGHSQKIETLFFPELQI